MKNKILSYIAITFICTIWGLSYLSSEVMLKVFHPMSLAFYRYLIALILLLLVNILGKNSLKIDRKDVPRFMLGGIFGIALYYTFENYGIELTSASIASIIIGTIPIISMLTEVVFFKNKVSITLIISTILSLIGVILVIN